MRPAPMRSPRITARSTPSRCWMRSSWRACSIASPERSCRRDPSLHDPGRPIPTQRSPKAAHRLGCRRRRRQRSAPRNQRAGLAHHLYASPSLPRAALEMMPSSGAASALHDPPYTREQLALRPGVVRAAQCWSHERSAPRRSFLPDGRACSTRDRAAARLASARSFPIRRCSSPAAWVATGWHCRAGWRRRRHHLTVRSIRRWRSA